MLVSTHDGEKIVRIGGTSAEYAHGSHTSSFLTSMLIPILAGSGGAF
jgi:hypothetical protein